MSKSKLTFDVNPGKKSKMASQEQQSPPAIDDFVNKYYQSRPSPWINPTENELEVKFGTVKINKTKMQLRRSDYDNVIKKLLSQGFSCEGSSGAYSLRISTTKPEDEKTFSFNRIEVDTFESIQKYCETNNIADVKNNTKFIQKRPARSPDGSKLSSVENRDFNFKITWSKESPVRSNDIISEWKKTRKTFRFINRVAFTHADYPVKVDVSIVKSSKNIDRYLPDGKDEKGEDKYTSQPETFTDVSSSGVFTAPEKYEIEIEVDNSKIGYGTKFERPEQLVVSLKKVIKFVLCGIQKTNYPIKFEEQLSVKMEYWKLFTRKQTTFHGKPSFERYNFIGPNPVTLQVENVKPTIREGLPNIRNNYVVTDKADGERSLLFVSEEGKIYLISNSMEVRFTGAVTINKKIFKTLIDGELVTHDKEMQPMNLFLGFDLYCYGGNDTRKLPLISVAKKEDSRYRLLQEIIFGLGAQSVLGSTIPSPITVQSKTFLPENPTNDGPEIFEACKVFLDQKNFAPYETDGLIFTPAFLCVYGSEGVKCDEVPNKSLTWYGAFKWKPPEFNTVDFLVSTVKDKDGRDEIVRTFSNGMNTERVEQDESFKIIELKVSCKKGEGNPNLRPCEAILRNEYTVEKDKTDNFDTFPLTFIPVDPVDPHEGRCTIKLDLNGQMRCEGDEGEVFRDKMIVEFSYDTEQEVWKPLRVRHDKTNAMLSRTTGVKYGNTYEVALSNWISIHNQVKEEMLKTGDIPENQDKGVVKEVYYSNSDKNKGQRGLREYHNYYKSKLVNAVSRQSKERVNLLIDYACGLGGDIPKWNKANIKFVLGIDLFENNINRSGGACSRYVNLRIEEEGKSKKDVMQAIFLQGNSSRNIKDGAAFGEDSNNNNYKIVRALFNDRMSEEEIKALGNGVWVNRGVAREGFDISSCQFALHYFFKDVPTLRGFITNLFQCTKLNGYFIGTAFDGKKIFNLLRKNNGKKEFRDEVTGTVTLSIESGYNDDDATFLERNDSSTLGKEISVYQESIGQNIVEYLINFDYFNAVMLDFGFVPLSDEEAVRAGLPRGVGGIGPFDELLKQYIRDKDQDKLEDYALNLTEMTKTEKQISALSMYFVYKKISNIEPSQHIMREEEMAVVGEEDEEEFEIIIEKPNKITKLKGAEPILLTEDVEDVQLNLKNKKKRNTEEEEKETKTRKPPTKKNKNEPPAELKKVYTITFGDVAENHAKMQKIGTLHEKGYSVAQLRDIQKKLTDLGLTTEMVDLNIGFETFPEAKVLVIRKGAQFILSEATTAGLMAENDRLTMDKKALMRGKVVNKVARWNLCFADEDQEPNYEDGKGRVVAWEHVPRVSAIRERIADWTNDVLLNGEANYYYDISQCGIGFHGDAERRKVFAVRMGETMPLYFKWFKESVPVGEPIELILNDGDMYIMSEKAVGFDWLKKKIPTLRHSTGCTKFTGVEKK